MNPEFLELALKKQRLQIRAGQQRADLLGRLGRVEAVLDMVDRARDGARELRGSAPLLSAGALLFVVLKPRVALRMARRAWLGWLIYRKLGRSLEPLLGVLKRFGA